MAISVLCPAYVHKHAAIKDYLREQWCHCGWNVSFLSDDCQDKHYYFCFCLGCMIYEWTIYFWNTWHFWPLIHQLFGVILLQRLKYSFIPLQIFSVFSCHRKYCLEFTHKSYLSGEQVVFRGRHTRTWPRSSLENTVPVSVLALKSNFSFSYTSHFCHDGKTNQKLLELSSLERKVCFKKRPSEYKICYNRDNVINIGGFVGQW